jgi:hypothetical protein
MAWDAMPLEIQQLLTAVALACAALWCGEHKISMHEPSPALEAYVARYVADTACTEADWTSCGTMLGP